MSALYTLCHGRTIAGVTEIGQPGASAASAGKTEPGHIARYHCLMATSPRGFLTGDTWKNSAHEFSSLVSAQGGGVAPARARARGGIVFKVEGANVITDLRIQAQLHRRTSEDVNAILISTGNGLSWKEVWQNTRTGDAPLELRLGAEVNGTYEVLVKVVLVGQTHPADAQLPSISFETIALPE